MTKRKDYKAPGWESQPVSWSYSVSFKKPRGKRLLWISTDAQDQAEASRRANMYMDENRSGEGFREYGISKTYWRHWGGYSEPITEDEYEFAQDRAKCVEYINKTGELHTAIRRAKKEGFSPKDACWDSAFWEAKPWQK